MKAFQSGRVGAFHEWELQKNKNCQFCLKRFFYSFPFVTGSWVTLFFEDGQARRLFFILGIVTGLGCSGFKAAYISLGSGFNQTLQVFWKVRKGSRVNLLRASSASKMNSKLSRELKAQKLSSKTRDDQKLKKLGLASVRQHQQSFGGFLRDFGAGMIFKNIRCRTRFPW